MIGRLFEGRLVVAVGIFLLVGALLVVATVCVGIIEYEQHPDWSSKEFSLDDVNKFFQIGDSPK